MENYIKKIEVGEKEEGILKKAWNKAKPVIKWVGYGLAFAAGYTLKAILIGNVRSNQIVRDAIEEVEAIEFGGFTDDIPEEIVEINPIIEEINDIPAIEEVSEL